MGASALDKLQLLMWKNALQQWRHKVQSVAEVLLPVATASLILVVRMEVHVQQESAQIYPEIPAYSLEYSLRVISGMDHNNITVAYSPRSEILQTTIQDALLTLLFRNFKLTSALPLSFEHRARARDIRSSDATSPKMDLPFSVVAYNSSDQLRGLILPNNATRQILAAVQFDDSLLGATQLPDNVNYVLRFPSRPRLSGFFQAGSSKWWTDAVFPEFATPGPRFPYSWEGGNRPGYVNELFIALQHSISMQLISTLSNNAELPEVFIQRLPHPPYLNDPLITIMQFLMPMLVMLSFTYTTVSTTRFVAREKELQLKESMKIMGLPTAMHWTAWFLKQFLFLLITIALVVVVFKVTWRAELADSSVVEYAIFTHTPWHVLMLFLCLYIAAAIFFAFMVSGMFAKASTGALVVAVLWFLSYLPAWFVTGQQEVPTAAKVSACLSLNSAMAVGFSLIMTYEGMNRGLQWPDFFERQSADDDFLFGHVCLMLLLDCFLYMLLALYIEKVRPGEFGVPQPWYFPVLPSYWCPNKPAYSELENDSDVVSEKEPDHLEKGVVIQNLTKVYSRNQLAVNSLNINMYKDQITVLLGHNGAGKTTTISMLTGLIPPTRGSATLAGYDITTQLSSARNSLGICPQHNVLFSELTVREHLQFFSRLKGFKGERMKRDVDQIIRKLELEEKADSQAQHLSGGQKRRLCVGVALCGAPQVVLLDEPTSGMDPSSRRALWDLLQTEKKSRSIILTTHFMDEAEILGDRIAIMAAGQLRCVGSPYFLKQHYGQGYTLVVVQRGDCDVEALTSLLLTHIPDVELEKSKGSELYYTVPIDNLAHYKSMLEDLERNLERLKVNSYGLVPTTIEDVFMKVGADRSGQQAKSEDTLTEEESDTTATTVTCSCGGVCPENLCTNPESNCQGQDRVRGWRLLINHAWAMWLKRGLVTLRDWKMTLLQCVIPMFVAAMSVVVIRTISRIATDSPPRLLDINVGYINTDTLISTGSPSDGQSEAMKTAYRNMFAETHLHITDIGDDNMTEKYIEMASDPTDMSRMRTRNVIAATFGSDQVTAWFSNFGYHDVAVSLSAVHNSILRSLVGDQARIYVVNHPLPVTENAETDVSILHQMLAIQIGDTMGTALSIATSFFVFFYIKERITRAKLLQKASGIQPVVMWGAAAVFDWCWFLIIDLLIIVVFAVLEIEGMSGPAALSRAYLLLLVYAASVLPLQYLVSFLFSGSASGFVLSYFIHIFLGNIGATIVNTLNNPTFTTQDVALGMHAVLRFFPTYTMINAFRDIATTGLTETSCLELCTLLPELPSEQCGTHHVCEAGYAACCLGDNPYFSWERPGISQHLVTLVGTGAALWIILLLIEYRIFDKLFRFIAIVPPPVDYTKEDDDVIAEERDVKHATDEDKSKYNLLCTDLTKRYGRKFIAVNQVSFGVRPAECFGLLGVNGAGKTSTFKMLTGDLAVSAGDARVRSHSVRTHIKKVHREIGYCPQFDALFDELTGRETLRLYALLRGLRASQTHEHTLRLARQLDFIKHIDKKVKHYSGGNRRKLSAAVALLGHASVIYLDEPTTGVDPAAKRQVWRAISHCRRQGRSVVLTSHSMEECEALCTRLAIMVNGRFRCLGSPQHLKNKFSQGYTATVKLMNSEEKTSKQISDETNQYIAEQFPGARLVESHQGISTYYLPDRRVPWSRMFGVLERARGRLVQDYLISQTSLEQVFLQFTKYQIEDTRDSA